MAAAQPRDLVLDERGLAYLRGRDGSLRPYGHGMPAEAAKPVQQARPGGGGTKTTVIKNSRWTGGGTVQTAAGRIYFHMDGTGYVCSGTVVTDQALGRSIILTAAHCVFDDVAKRFATKVMFIPKQDDGGADRTDLNCTNDEMGCWVPTDAVVDANWKAWTFPDNIPWDYGYYIVPTSGAHQGNAATSDSLELAAKSLTVSFLKPTTGISTHALGYSYSNDPYFMYCAQGMGTNGSANWWLSSCGLSGGASGGPWMQPFDNGNGTVISVNSWGYNGQPGMAGPKLNNNSAADLMRTAEGNTPSATAVVGTISAQ